MAKSNFHVDANLSRRVAPVIGKLAKPSEPLSSAELNLINVDYRLMTSAAKLPMGRQPLRSPLDGWICIVGECVAKTERVGFVEANQAIDGFVDGIDGMVPDMYEIMWIYDCILFGTNCLVNRANN